MKRRAVHCSKKLTAGVTVGPSPHPLRREHSSCRITLVARPGVAEPLIPPSDTTLLILRIRVGSRTLRGWTRTPAPLRNRPDCSDVLRAFLARLWPLMVGLAGSRPGAD